MELFFPFFFFKALSLYLDVYPLFARTALHLCHMKLTYFWHLCTGILGRLDCILQKFL